MSIEHDGRHDLEASDGALAIFLDIDGTVTERGQRAWFASVLVPQIKAAEAAGVPVHVILTSYQRYAFCEGRTARDACRVATDVIGIDGLTVDGFLPWTPSWPPPGGPLIVPQASRAAEIQRFLRFTRYAACLTFDDDRSVQKDAASRAAVGAPLLRLDDTFDPDVVAAAFRRALNPGLTRDFVACALRHLGYTLTFTPSGGPERVLQEGSVIEVPHNPEAFAWHELGHAVLYPLGGVLVTSNWWPRPRWLAEMTDVEADLWAIAATAYVAELYDPTGCTTRARKLPSAQGLPRLSEEQKDQIAATIAISLRRAHRLDV